MPIYEFKCKECNKKFEELCSAGTSAGDLKCPACGRGNLQRCFSSFGFTSSGGQRDSDISSFSPPSVGSGCSSCYTRNCSTCH